MSNFFRRTAAGAYIANTATVLGEVRLGAETSVWFSAVVRGDVAPITVGERVSIQDGSVVHCDTGIPNRIEDDVTIGHRAVVHGVRVGRGSLIGMGAVLLGRTEIGEECLIAAGAVVPPGTIVPDRSLGVGVPGKIVRGVSEKEHEYMRWLSRRYVDLCQRYDAGEFDALQ
ncbi:MAG: gamma carbonic anhydrase family protein [Planctomycetaceae bacterium]|nr:gamma carbonic anhydrase family protein [Planctomycetaceae bacterium]